MCFYDSYSKIKIIFDYLEPSLATTHGMASKKCENRSYPNKYPCIVLRTLGSNPKFGFGRKLFLKKCGKMSSKNG